MTTFNLADLWETLCDAGPEAECLVAGPVRHTRRSLDQAANRIAHALRGRGRHPGDHVGIYSRNRAEYVESLLGCWKAGMVPINLNWRYVQKELRHVIDDAELVAIIVEDEYAPMLDDLGFEQSIAIGSWTDQPTDRNFDDVPRSGDDVYMLYTGGTTGMPKGVMWRQDDLVMLLAAQLGGTFPDEPDYDAVRALRTAPGPVALPACPLMHGTGALISMVTLSQAGCVVLLSERNYDPVELLDTIERDRANVVVIVGDAFAKPMLRALDAEPGRWDLSSVLGMTSSGVMWSEETKQGLLRHHGAMMLMDGFSSSEALGMGVSISGGGSTAETAKFQLGPNARVITEDGRFVEPGSEEIGMVGVGGRVPLGYYKDEEKSARTFKVIDGVRYSIPGDFATVEADGSIRLLGRGSVCINTGGEKVFPEEVEEALKTHPAVRDAVVVGVPDEKWGEAITALVEPAPGHPPDEAELITHVKGRIAAFKAPKRVLLVDSVGRAPNGKVDYKRCRAEAIERAGAATG